MVIANTQIHDWSLSWLRTPRHFNKEKWWG